MSSVEDASADLGTRLGTNALMSARNLSMSNMELHNAQVAVAGSEAEGACVSIDMEPHRDQELINSPCHIFFNSLHKLTFLLCVLCVCACVCVPSLYHQPPTHGTVRCYQFINLSLDLCLSFGAL